MKNFILLVCLFFLLESQSLAGPFGFFNGPFSRTQPGGTPPIIQQPPVRSSRTPADQAYIDRQIGHDYSEFIVDSDGKQIPVPRRLQDLPRPAERLPPAVQQRPGVQRMMQYSRFPNAPYIKPSSPHMIESQHSGEVHFNFHYNDRKDMPDFDAPAYEVIEHSGRKGLFVPFKSSTTTSN